ncbi:hypothetical protein CAPTEDRAFT_173440, partial [Capitella teleta]
MAAATAVHSRVHFPADQVQQHDSEIVVQTEAESTLGVHLGFLQIHHQYEIRFTIRDTFSEELLYDPLNNLHVKICSVAPSEDGLGHELILDFSAYKEKLMKEEIVLTDATDPSKKLKLMLYARVLGKGKGTPALRNGIHCTGINADYESEHSDWQGFD